MRNANSQSFIRRTIIRRTLLFLIVELSKEVKMCQGRGGRSKRGCPVCSTVGGGGDDGGGGGSASMIGYGSWGGGGDPANCTGCGGIDPPVL